MTWRVPHYLPETIFTCAVVFGPLAFGAVEPWALALLSIAVYATMSCCALRGMPDLRHSIYRTILPGVAVVVLIGLIQRLNPRSILETSGWLPTTTSAYATTRALWVWGTYAAALWCVPQVFVGVASLRRFMRVIFFLGVFVAVVGIIQMTQNRLLIYGLRVVPVEYEPFGPYYNRDHAASLLIMSIFCGIGVLWDRSILRKELRDRTDVYTFAATQSLILFAIAVSLRGLAFSLSRGALAAMLVTGLGLGLWVSWTYRRRLVWVGLGVALVVCIVSYSPMAIRFTKPYIQAAVDYRLSLYRGGAAIFLDFPWLGTGLGSLQYAYPPYQSKEIAGFVEHIHSDWLELLIQIGIIGLSVYVLGLVLFLRSCWRASSSRESSFGLTCGASAAIVAFMLHGLGDFAFQIPANSLIFFSLLGVLGVLSSGSGRLETTRFSRLDRSANISVAFTALVLAINWVPSAAASWRYLKIDESSPLASAEQLSKVIALDPGPKYRFKLAQYKLSLADQLQDERTGLLHEALSHSQAIIRVDSANPRVRSLNGNILWRLGRVADGQALIGKH